MKQLCYQLIVPISGLSIALLEIVMTSVYQFQLLGFALGFILLVCSGIYLY